MKLHLLAAASLFTVFLNNAHAAFSIKKIVETRDKVHFHVFGCLTPDTIRQTYKCSSEKPSHPEVTFAIKNGFKNLQCFAATGAILAVPKNRLPKCESNSFVGGKAPLGDKIYGPLLGTNCPTANQRTNITGMRRHFDNDYREVYQLKEKLDSRRITAEYYDREIIAIYEQYVTHLENVPRHLVIPPSMKSKVDAHLREAKNFLDRRPQMGIRERISHYQKKPSNSIHGTFIEELQETINVLLKYNEGWIQSDYCPGQRGDAPEENTNSGKATT